MGLRAVGGGSNADRNKVRIIAQNTIDGEFTSIVYIDNSGKINLSSVDNDDYQTTSPYNMLGILEAAGGSNLIKIRPLKDLKVSFSVTKTTHKAALKLGSYQEGDALSAGTWYTILGYNRNNQLLIIEASL